MCDKKKITPGQKFGELTAKQESVERLRGEIAWICECSCGNKTLATKGQLLRGAKKSCGCLRKKSPVNTIDMVGREFGKLTVIERSGATKNDNAQWLCQCDCGETTIAMGTSLRRGDTVSCGCDNIKQITKAREILHNELSVDGVQLPLLTKKVRSDSGTGHKGVSKRVRKGRISYEVSIGVKGKRIHVGTYKTLGVAIAARKAAEEKYHKPYLED